jgi:hypothetical protein
MNQHTQGPWAFEYSNDVGPDDDYFIEFFEILTKDCKVLARVEEEPDARLIAAAPDLLQVVEDALMIFEFGDDDKTVATPYWVARARAAIAKATGEQP